MFKLSWIYTSSKKLVDKVKYWFLMWWIKIVRRGQYVKKSVCEKIVVYIGISGNLVVISVKPVSISFSHNVSRKKIIFPRIFKLKECSQSYSLVAVECIYLNFCSFFFKFKEEISFFSKFKQFHKVRRDSDKKLCEFI